MADAEVIPPIDFVLSALDADLTMAVKALLPEGTLPEELTGIHATATYQVSLTEMKKAFYFQSDSSDVTNVAADDIKYFVSWPAEYKLNPSHALVTDSAIATTDAGGAIPPTRMLVKHDFIRHIAFNLFNTHLAVDLFKNEQELSEDLAGKGDTAWTSTIKTAIDAVSAQGSLAAPLGYMTNELPEGAPEGTVESDNLCRCLFQQILNKDIHRFDDLSSWAMPSVGDNVAKTFYMPFKVSDSISFKVTLKAEPTQHDITNNGVPVPDRTYRIKLDIVEAPQYITVDDTTDFTNSVVKAPIA